MAGQDRHIVYGISNKLRCFIYIYCANTHLKTDVPMKCCTIFRIENNKMHRFFSCRFCWWRCCSIHKVGHSHQMTAIVYCSYSFCSNKKRSRLIKTAIKMVLKSDNKPIYDREPVNTVYNVCVQHPTHEHKKAIHNRCGNINGNY